MDVDDVIDTLYAVLRFEIASSGPSAFNHRRIGLYNETPNGAGSAGSGTHPAHARLRMCCFVSCGRSVRITRCNSSHERVGGKQLSPPIPTPIPTLLRELERDQVAHQREGTTYTPLVPGAPTFAASLGLPLYLSHSGKEFRNSRLSPQRIHLPADQLPAGPAPFGV